MRERKKSTVNWQRRERKVRGKKIMEEGREGEWRRDMEGGRGRHASGLEKSIVRGTISPHFPHSTGIAYLSPSLL